MVISNEKFIIGLGNPGEKYIDSRHNIGFMVIQEISNKYNLKFTSKNKLKSYYSEFSVDNELFRLFMPNTYMNKSGESVKSIIDWYKIELDQVLVIVDDIDLPLGKIRFRKRGGSGGHNGLKSIIKQLNSEDFSRIRIGIGAPPPLKENKNLNTISHVLGNFSKSDKLILKKINLKIIESIERLDDYNIDKIICDLNSFKP